MEGAGGGIRIVQGSEGLLTYLEAEQRTFAVRVGVTVTSALVARLFCCAARSAQVGEWDRVNSVVVDIQVLVAVRIVTDELVGILHPPALGALVVVGSRNVPAEAFAVGPEIDGVVVVRVATVVGLEAIHVCGRLWTEIALVLSLVVVETLAPVQLATRCLAVVDADAAEMLTVESGNGCVARLLKHARLTVCAPRVLQCVAAGTPFVALFQGAGARAASLLIVPAVVMGVVGVAGIFAAGNRHPIDEVCTSLEALCDG